MTTLFALLLLSPQEELRRPEEIEQLRIKTAYPLDEGALEIDAVASVLELDEDRFEHLRDFDGRVARLSGEVAYGIESWLTGEVRVPYLRVDPDDDLDGGDETGVGDAEVELKAGLPREWAPVDAALGLRASLPTAEEERGLGSAEPEFTVYLAGSGQIFGFAAHVQVFAEGEREERPQFGVNAALDVAPFAPNLSLLLGVNALAQRGESAYVALVPGFEVRLENPRIHVGAGVPIGLSEEAEEWGVIADLQVGF